MALFHFSQSAYMHCAEGESDRDKISFKVVKLLIFLKKNTILGEHIACNVYSSSSGACVIYS